MKRRLFGLSAEEIACLLQPYGFAAYRSLQIAEWLYRHSVKDFTEMTNLSKQQRELLAEHFYY